MKTCSKCGLKTKKDIKFCPDCGKQFLKEKVKRKKSKLPLILGILLLLLLLVFFLVPFPFTRADYYSATVQYQGSEEYQKTVYQDNCDSSSLCVCTGRGGFLWSKCVKCTCRETRGVTKEGIVFKETSTTSYATLFDIARSTRVSKTEARTTVQKLLDHDLKKSGDYATISNVYKDGNNWVVVVTPEYVELVVDGWSGRIRSLRGNGREMSYGAFISEFNELD